MNIAAPSTSVRSSRTNSSGFTLTNLLVSIAIIGILSSVAIGSFRNIREGARRGVAMEVVNDLNQAIADHSQVNWEIDVRAHSGSDEEQWILLTLQWRDSSAPALGSPFMNPNWNPVISDSTDEFRIRWNGKVFELREPGQNGRGFKVNFDGASDLGDSVSHPAGFYPVGPGYHSTAPVF